MVRKESLAQLLDEGRRKIQVTDEELAEAKRRRRLLAASARRAFAGSTTYFNGSVAHGDANTPLTGLLPTLPDRRHIRRFQSLHPA